MDQINIIVKSVKMMKLTYFALCIFAFKINENFADIEPDPTICKKGKICDDYDYEGCTEKQESQGNCLNDPDKTCYCPYQYPTPKPVICKQGKQCEKYVINNFYTISLHKLTNAKS